MNTEIKNWLEGDARDYTEGLNIFVGHSKNRSVVNYLLRKRDAKKLAYEMSKLAGDVLSTSVAQKSEKKVITEKSNVITSANNVITLQSNVITSANKDVPAPPSCGRLKITADGKIRAEDLPEILRGYYYANVEDIKLARQLHEKMKSATSDGERAELRLKLCDADETIAFRWKAIDLWAATGELPTPAPTNETAGGSENSENSDGSGKRDLTVQEVGKYRASVSRCLAELEKEDITDENRDKYRLKLETAVNALLAGGQSFADETTARIGALIPINKQSGDVIDG